MLVRLPVNVSGLEVVIEAEQLRYWCHIYSPVDISEIRAELCDSLAAAKQGYWLATARHDHAAAGAALREVNDLTALLAAVAEGIDDARRRWLASDRPWPLSLVP